MRNFSVGSSHGHHNSLCINLLKILSGFLSFYAQRNASYAGKVSQKIVGDAI